MTDTTTNSNLENSLINASYALRNLHSTIDSLKFWIDIPEVKSISLSANYEYNDEGGTYRTISVYDITFVSDEAKKTLYERLTGEDTDEGFDIDFEVDPYEWRDLLDFSSYPEFWTDQEADTATFTRPENPELELQESLRVIYMELIKTL